MNSDHYAIVVGVDHYEKKAWTPLQGARNDARAFREWLLDPDGGALPEANVDYITSDEARTRPTLSLIDDAVERHIQRSQMYTDTAGRRLYVFFSGHGIVDEDDEDDEVYLVLPQDRALRAAQYPGKRLATHFRRSAIFDEVVLALDCCREFVGEVGRHWLFKQHVDKDRMATVRYLHVFAAGKGRKARETPEAPGGAVRGVFSRVFLDALRGVGSPAGAAITSATVKAHVTASMAAAGRAAQLTEVLDHGEIVFGTAPPPPVTLRVSRGDPTRPVAVVDGGDLATTYAPDDPSAVPLAYRVPPPRGVHVGYGSAGPAPAGGTLLDGLAEATTQILRPGVVTDVALP